MIKSYPLQWPVGWKRCKTRRSGRFVKKGEKNSYGFMPVRSISEFDGLNRILSEFEKMGIDRQDIVISTNLETRLDGLPLSGQRKPDDPGVAVYCEERRGEKKNQRCMAIDIYDDVAQNLGAVAATLDAMRAIERHGGAAVLDRAFTGFAALPERSDVPGWRDVFQITGNVTAEMLKGKYRELAKIHHPDVGGDAGAFAIISRAYEQGLQELTQ